MYNYFCEAFLKNIPCPVFIMGLDKKYIYVNEQYYDILHLKHGEVIGESIMNVIPKHLSSVFSSRVDCVALDGKLREYETQIYNRYIKCYLFPLKDKLGVSTAFAGLLIDISDRREKEIELSNQKNILQTIIDTIPDPIFYKDLNSRYIGANKKSLSDLSKMNTGSVIGKNDMEIMFDKDMARKFMEDDQKIIKERVILTNRPKMTLPTGEVRIKESVKAPIIDDNDNVIGVVGLARDITEKYKMERQLEYLSYTDILTGLYNRTSFEYKIKELKKEEHLPLGVIMGDVNGLKLINDTFGHIEGDNLLVSISNVLKKCCAEFASIFRWGGDEFVIILPNVDEKKCGKIIDNIKKACKEYSTNTIELSISLGQSVLTSLDDDIYEALKEAEGILYRHKLFERNNLLSSSIVSLLKTLETKSLETEQHTGRMIKGAIAIGKKLNLSVAKMDELMLAVKLHDIGKITLDEKILKKSGLFTDNEFELMKTHSEKGYRIVKACNGLESVARGVLYHHERYDGKGYPMGMKGKDIPVISRIISIVDAYDAMTNKSLYKEPVPEDEAIKEIIRGSGAQFDPEIASYFLEYMKEESSYSVHVDLKV